MLICVQCRHCGGPIESDHEELNRAATCPHCGQQTYLAVPRTAAPVIENIPQPAASRRQPASAGEFRWWYLSIGLIVGTGLYLLMVKGGELGQQIGIGIGISLGLYVYFFPAIVANRNKKRNFQAIFMLNLFLGWMLIGWVVALVWAMTRDPEKP